VVVGTFSWSAFWGRLENKDNISKRNKQDMMYTEHTTKLLNIELEYTLVKKKF